MTTPLGVPDDLTQLLQNNELRPKGRRHRRDERQVYGAYPSIVNQSFDFERPTVQHQSNSPLNPYRQPRPIRVPVQTSPSSIVPTAGHPSRPASIAPSQTPASTPAPASHQSRPASITTSQTAIPPRPLPAPPSVSVRPLAHQPSIEEIGSWGDFAHIIPFVETDVEVPPAQTVIRAPATLRQSHQEEILVTPTLVASARLVAAPSKSIQSSKSLPRGPRTAETKVSPIMDELEDDISCPICMNVMVGACLLSPCGHGSCGPCIVPWLETRASTGEQTNCPVCRERVSKRHPLVPARNLEAVVIRWVEHKMKTGGWDGYEDWVERTETWKIHKKFTPSLISPELFNCHSHSHSHSPTTPGPETQSVFADPSNRLQRTISPLDLFGSLPLMRSALLDGFFPDHRQSYFDTGNSYVHPPTIDPFQHLSEMGFRFEATRDNILQDMARSRQ